MTSPILSVRWEVIPLFKSLWLVFAVPVPLHNVAGVPVSTASPSEFVPV